MKNGELKLPEQNQRVKFLVDHFSGGNVADFVQKLNGISHQSLNRIFNVDRRTHGYPGVSSGIMTAIMKAYPEVNPSWLLTGDGAMLRTVTGVRSLDSTMPTTDGQQGLDRLKRLEDDQAKYVRKLEEDNERLWGLVKDNQDIIKTNLTLVLATVRTISVRQLGTGNVAMKSLERIEKSAGLKPGSLVKEVDKEIGQIERESFERGSVPAQSR